jgi:hypothetical protein
MNLHHGGSVPPTCCEHADAAIIQEPWIYGGQIRGSVSSEETSFVTSKENAKSCIYVRNNINVPPLLELCYRNTAMVRNTYKWREWEDNHCLHSILFV